MVKNMSKLNFTIYVTTRCNMNCHYCYEKDFVPLDMSLVTANKVVSFIREKVSKEKAEVVNIQFHGGEPLLNFPVIQFLMNELGKKVTYNHADFFYTMTTNATLLKEEMIPILPKIHHLSVSIDGKEHTHNQNRIFENQQGTYHVVKRNIEKLLEIKTDITGRITLVPSTYKEVYSSFLHIFDLGIRNIEIELDFVGKDWTEEMIDEYVTELKKIADKVNEKREMGINLEVPLLSSAIRKSKNSICDGGRTSFTITADGKIYPCVVSISLNEFLLGDIGKPLNEEVLNRIEDVARVENPSCSGCARYDYCKMTRCKIINYIYNNDYHTPSPIMCINEHIKINMGKYFKSTI